MRKRIAALAAMKLVAYWQAGAVWPRHAGDYSRRKEPVINSTTEGSSKRFTMRKHARRLIIGVLSTGLLATGLTSAVASPAFAATWINEGYFWGQDNTGCRIAGDVGLNNGEWLTYQCIEIVPPPYLGYGEWELYAFVD
jgi:hypothetical protein